MGETLNPREELTCNDSFVRLFEPTKMSGAVEQESKREQTKTSVVGAQQSMREQTETLVARA